MKKQYLAVTMALLFAMGTQSIAMANDAVDEDRVVVATDESSSGDFNNTCTISF